MKILFVGVLDKEWSTNCSMKRALEDSGHTVVPFNYRTISDKYNLSSISYELLDMWLDKLASFLRSEKVPLNFGWYYRRRGRKEMNGLLLDEVRRNGFDLVLLSKTDTVDYRLLTRINRYSPTWFFFMDPMDQARRVNAKAYAVQARWASATFSDVAEHFKKAGANAYWITQGVDTEVFKPKPLPKSYDVVFVGTKTAKRQRYINALEKAGISVTCFGEGWRNAPVYQGELVDIYRRSRIILNFCRAGKGFSIRVFQVMGTGSFLLSEYCSDFEAFFKAGFHLDWFKDEEGLVDKAKHYLANESECQKIATQGSAYVYENCSWKKSMNDICKTAKV